MGIFTILTKKKQEDERLRKAAADAMDAINFVMDVELTGYKLSGNEIIYTDKNGEEFRYKKDDILNKTY